MPKIWLMLITYIVISYSQETIHIQNIGNGKIATKKIVFQQPFQSKPQVAISLLNAQYQLLAEVINITNEGFTISIISESPQNVEFTYTALENDGNYQIECINRIGTGKQIEFPLIIDKPTFIGVLATNIHENYFSIDFMDGNIIVDNNGHLNMCIIITNQNDPIQLYGYSNYKDKEQSQFHQFKKQNAMSLVQAQQSLEIMNLDQHKSLEIWHHHSVELIRDDQKSHLSLQIDQENDNKQSIEIINQQFQQKESLEIYQLDNENLIIQNQDQTNNNNLISQEINLTDPSLEINQISESSNNQENNEDNQSQLEDISFDNISIENSQEKDEFNNNQAEEQLNSNEINHQINETLNSQQQETTQQQSQQIDNVVMDSDIQQPLDQENQQQELESVNFDEDKQNQDNLSVIDNDSEFQYNEQQDQQQQDNNEVKLENVKVTEVQEQEQNEEINQFDINSEESIQEKELDQMIKAAEELKNKAKEMKNLSKIEQFDAKQEIKQVAQDLEEKETQIVEDVKIIEDSVNLNVDDSYNKLDESEIQQTNQDQPPIIYLNDSDIQNQQLINQEVNMSSSQNIESDLNQHDQITETIAIANEGSEEQMNEKVEQINNEQFNEKVVQNNEEDHQELEIYESQNVEILEDVEESPVNNDIIIENENQQIQEQQFEENEQQQNDNQNNQEQEQENSDNQIIQETQDDNGTVEIGLTTDEGDQYIKKPKKSDFMREKQKLKDKLSNVIRDLRLDTANNDLSESEQDSQKQYSLIIDRLDVPENNNQVIELKDEQTEQNIIYEKEPIQTQEVKYLGDFVEPIIDNVTFLYDGEEMEQSTIQVDDIRLNDQSDELQETNYKIVQAVETEDEEVLQSIEDHDQDLISQNVSIQDENNQEQSISLDDFQQELNSLKNQIESIKKEENNSKKQGDYIVINDNSQIYDINYDEESNNNEQEIEVNQAQNEEQYYQMDEQKEEQVQQEQQVQQEPDLNQEQIIDQDQQFDLDDISVKSINAEQNEDQQNYDTEQQESQEQYLTIDNSLKEVYGDQIESTQYYDDQQQDSIKEDQKIQQNYNNNNQIQEDYDFNDDDINETNENSEEFVVLKPEDIKNQLSQTKIEGQEIDQQIEVFENNENDENNDINDNNNKQDDLNNNDDENNINIYVVKEQQNQESIQQDYDIGDDVNQQEIQQKSQPKKIKIKQKKQKVIDRSIEITHKNEKKNNLEQRSFELEKDQDQNEQIEKQNGTQQDFKDSLKEQLKQELKEELRQELYKEMQENSKNNNQIHTEKINKDPNRPAQKAINKFNDLFKDVVDTSLKEDNSQHFHKLPIIDINQNTFDKIEPEIEAGIEDLKKSLGLKGGIEVIGENGKKQVINVDDLKQSLQEKNEKEQTQYEEFLKQVTDKQKNSASYQEQRDQRKQEILENIKRELEIKKGRFTVPSDQNNELSPYEFERVYLDWEQNKEDIIPSMFKHSVGQQPQKNDEPQIDFIEESTSMKQERMSKKEEVEKEVQELLWGNNKDKKNQKSQLKNFKVEDLKYIKDDPLLDQTYTGFIQLKGNLRKGQK